MNANSGGISSISNVFEDLRQINLDFPLSRNARQPFDIGYEKRESLVHRTATTSYPCYGQVLGEFGGSWSCTTFPTANIAIFSRPAKFLMLQDHKTWFSAKIPDTEKTKGLTVNIVKPLGCIYEFQSVKDCQRRMEEVIRCWRTCGLSRSRSG